MVNQAPRWPFPPNWGNRVVETSEFRTEIITSRSGREQRGMLRYRPRRTLAFDVLVRRGQLHEFSRIMQGQHHLALSVPNPVEKTALTVTAAAGTLVLAVETTPAWLVAGTALVLQRDGDAEIVVVDSVAGTDVTLTEPLLKTWAWASKVHRAFASRLQQTIRTVNETSSVVRASVVFEGEPGFVADPDVGTPFPLYDGKELFSRKPNWAERVTLDYDSNIEAVDYGFGRTSFSTPVDFRTRIMRAVWLGRNEADVAEIKAFFHRMGGQCGEFYMPTWLDEIRPSFAPEIGDSVLQVSGTLYALSFQDDPVNKAVSIFHSDGTFSYRKVTSVDIVSGDSHLTLDAALTKAGVVYVSWMPVWRFAADRLDVEWQTDTVAQFSLTFRSLENLP